MKILFLGSDKIALPLLEVLKTKATALAIVSGIDKPTGRGQKLTPNDLSAWALANNVTLHRPQKLDDEFHAAMKAFAPDLIFVMAYGKLLKSALIDLPRLGPWNIHVSQLPALRGASPIETAIAIGEATTSVALMRMALALDAGPVAVDASGRGKITITEETTAHELREKIALVSAEIVEKNWSALAAGTLITLPQDEAQATYCRILRKDDGWLDPSEPAKILVRRVNAFAQWPGAAFIYAGERLKIFAARAIEDPEQKSKTAWQGQAGLVLEAGERLIIATGLGKMEILELQRAGGKRLSAKEFLRGYPIKVGERFFGKALRPLMDSKPFPRGF